MESPYLKFADLFYSLSPYDLQHMSECILCKIEESFEGKLCSKSCQAELTEKDIKFALTEAMKHIVIDLRQRELQIGKIKLKQARVLVYSDRGSIV